MLLSTVAEIKATAPDLTADMEDSTIEALISDASTQVLLDGFPKDVEVDGEKLQVRELATKYLTLHLATMDSKAGQGVSSEKVDVIEVHYQDKTKSDWLNSSTWGQMYLRMYQRYCIRRLPIGVIQH